MVERIGLALCLTIVALAAGILLFLAGSVVVTILSAILSII